MKSEDVIVSRIKTILSFELDKKVKEASKRKPTYCTFNYRHSLDSRKYVDGDPNPKYNLMVVGDDSQHIGLCMHASESCDGWNGTICEDVVDAQCCPLFMPIKDKTHILKDFMEQLATPGWVETNLPGVAELLWVLEDFEGPVKTLPWWKVLWYRWVLRLRVEPIQNHKLLCSFIETPPDEL